MAETIDVDDLAAELSKAVKNYTKDVQEAVDKEASSTATKVKKDIKQDSPRNSGEYADGWSRKTNRKNGVIDITIYNKEKPQLTHLLENGHQKVGGGRVPGIPHIKPAADKHLPRLEKKIEEIIKNGG